MELIGKEGSREQGYDAGQEARGSSEYRGTNLRLWKTWSVLLSGWDEWDEAMELGFSQANRQPCPAVFAGIPVSISPISHA